MDEAMQSAENCDRWMKRTTEEKGMFKYNPFSCFGVLHKGDCYYCLTLLGLSESPEPKAMRLPVHELTTLHKNKPFNSKGIIQRMKVFLELVAMRHDPKFLVF